MQNLPIIATTQPVTPAQTYGQTDNNTAQAAESFDSVLARQRAITDKPKPGTDNRDKSQNPSSSGSSPTDNLAVATCDELETPVTETINMLPGDMLTALLPATANGVVTNKKPVLQAPIPEGVSTLPSDMLAALLSTPSKMQPDTSASTQQPIATGVRDGVLQQPIAVGISQPIVVGASQQTISAGVLDGVLQQPIAASVQDDTRQQIIAAGVQRSAQQPVSTGQPIGEQAAASPLRTQGDHMPPIADANAAHSKAFSSVLEALGKDTANTALPASTTKVSAPDTTALTGLVQGFTSPVAASPNGPVQAVVNTPVTHGAWGNEFNQKITWLVTQHEQTAELHLNPPHLGPVDVVLNISGDQATALFTSPHAAVRDAMEQALPKLREMLADNGIMLGNATVNDQSPKEQQTWRTGKQQGENASLHGNTGDTTSASVTAWPARRHQGMVDTFV